jgi:hypothetical protein
VGPEDYSIFGALFMKKNTKLDKKMNIYKAFARALEGAIASEGT